MLSSELWYGLVNEMFDFIGNPRYSRNGPHLLNVNIGSERDKECDPCHNSPGNIDLDWNVR